MTRRSSALLVMAVCLALFGLANMAFVSAPEAARSEMQTVPKDRVAQAAALSAAVLTVPEIAHAGNSGYALLQLGWAVFIISLGPAVLFWVYFNKPELLWACAATNFWSPEIQAGSLNSKSKTSNPSRHAEKDAFVFRDGLIFDGVFTAWLWSRLKRFIG